MRRLSRAWDPVGLDGKLKKMHIYIATTGQALTKPARACGSNLIAAGLRFVESLLVPAPLGKGRPPRFATPVLFFLT
jgi:hypothetical protein